MLILEIAGGIILAFVAMMIPVHYYLKGIGIALVIFLMVFGYVNIQQQYEQRTYQVK